MSPKPAKTAMLSSSFAFSTCCLWWLFLSCEAVLHIPSRRILHEPYSTLSSDQPPPSPPTSSIHPLSTSPTSTQPGSPFFPSFPSAPPPPAPSSFASFPANISSLLIPHTPAPKHHPHNLFIIAVAAVFSATIIAAIIVFVYCRERSRRRGGHNCFDDNKTPTSDNSNTLYRSHNNNNNVVGSRKLRTTTTTSSEFLYLGNVVNSQSRFEEGYNDSPFSSCLDSTKMYSPELHPLPPLSRQNTSRDFRDGDVDSVTEYEEEEFYSPRESLGGRDSSSGICLTAVKSIESSTTCSCSSSSSDSGSPAKSQSLCISPQASFSPRWPDPKSPERILVDSPRVSDTSINGNIRSPSLSLTSTSLSSPNRVLIENLDASIKNFKNFVQNMKPPSILASAATNSSPPRDSSVCSALDSPSPNRAFQESPEMSPLKVDFSDYNNDPSFSSLASSSPERGLEKSPDHAPLLRLSKALQKSILSPPPLPPPLPKQRRLWETPVSSASFAKQIPKPPPLPKPRQLWEAPGSSASFAKQVPKPPPPPPPKQRRLWEAPVSSSSFAQQISKPLPPVMPTRSESEMVEEAEEGLKPKLKPLHWDKVRASSDREMVWDHLRSSSFQLNEEMIETLFVANTPNSKPKETTPQSVLSSPIQENRVLDPKKAQNIAILLKALNVTVEEVSEALFEGNADTLSTEFLESLLRMAPTKEEECKLKEYRDDSPVKLGPAEKFLKTVLDIPFAFKRVDAMLYIANFESEAEYLRISFETLEAACEELRNSRMFLKLLDAVLKTGNRMNVGTNRGDAHAFKLDTLLKLVDVKGADGKTTLLHFVVQEIIRAEGARLSNTTQTPISTLTEDARCRKLGLQVVSGLGSELTNVKKAAAMDSEVLGGYVCKLSRGLENISEVVRLNETMESIESKVKFSDSMSMFMQMAEQEIPRIQAHENLALSLVKEITEYFHGDSAKEEAHPFRIFLVVKDFLTVLDRVCKEVGMLNERTIVSSAHKFPVPVNPMMQQAFPVPVNPMLP